MMNLIARVMLSALLFILPVVAGCQAMSGKTIVETPQDTALSQSVKAKLSADKSLNLTSVEVQSDKGTVYLTGVVNSLGTREQAVKLAWEVSGVQTVVNHLEVQK